VARVYSNQLISGLCYEGVPLEYVVPSGTRTVVRDIVAYPPNVERPATSSLWVFHVESEAYIAFWNAVYNQPYRLYHWDGRQAAQAGEHIEVATDDPSGQPWSVRVFGYELTLP
jgi:hypothetical protein